MEIIYKKLDELIPYVNNPRNNKDAVDKVASSIKNFGFKVPIVLDSNNEIITGHTRLLASKKLKLKEVPCIIADDLTEAQVKAFRIADNKVAEFSEWDMELLNVEFEELKELDVDLDITGFDMADIDNLLGEDKEVEEDNFDVDEAIEDIKEPTAKRGQIYKLGEHRLMCGDSTSEEDVKALMDGEKADMVFTDPPYNTGMDKKNSNDSTWLNHFFDDNFTDEEWETFMSAFVKMYYNYMKDNSVAYICLDWRRNHELIPHIKNYFKLSNIIIWDKVVHGLGSDYKYTYELINVCKKGKPEMNTHQGDREYSDIWHIQRKMGKDEDHATKKPIELVTRPIKHSSKKNDLILDLFGGSGSTLLACEQTSRKCYMMELEPIYIDVIIKRWEEYTGRKAELING